MLNRIVLAFVFALAIASGSARADTAWSIDTAQLQWANASGSPEGYCVSIWSADDPSWKQVACAPSGNRPRVALPRCTWATFSVVAYKGATFGPPSDASQWIRACGNPDFDLDGMVKARDVAWEASLFGCAVDPKGPISCPANVYPSSPSASPAPLP